MQLCIVSPRRVFTLTVDNLPIVTVQGSKET